jgi:hypothetical protein
MLNIQKNKIYSVQTNLNQSGLIEIETVILNGLYRFSILGTNQKNSTETRDRVYSALRSQKLINLKSDNKKITVNLLPTNIDKKINICDLGIALGCLSCMSQINIDKDIIVIGELSILGVIIPSNFLLKTIYQAIKNNIKIIVCSDYDFDTLNKYKNNIKKLIIDNEIKFISSNSLNDLVQKIKTSEYSPLNTTECIDLEGGELNKKINIEYKSVNIFNINIFKIVLALCTKRNIFIENKKDSYIKKYIENLIYYNQKLNSEEIISISNVLDVNDSQIFEKYFYPKVSILDSQTQKNDLYIMLNESIFGFNIIEDFLNMSDESIYIIKKHNTSTVFCFYNVCPCGNNNIFFNAIGSSKCFCIQRNIIKYRQKIKKTENDFFDFYINNIDETVINYVSDDYVRINNIISQFRNTTLEIKEGVVSNDFIKNNINILERGYIDKIIILAKDIGKLNYIIKQDLLTLKKEDIELAVSLLKKDF